MTGSELARAVHARRPEMPVVVMSGFVSPALLERAREAGVAEVLSKPLAARDIARCLAAQFDDSRKNGLSDGGRDGGRDLPSFSM